MKKVLRKTLFLGTVVLSFFLASCKNFLEGDSFLQTLENTIEYVNAPYAKINLTCDSNALKVMVPAVGQITDYKAGDHFDISFEEKDEYQFIKWICEPADAVSFFSSENQQTKVTVLSTDQEIKIYPLVYERPTVSITPTGSISVEKNSQIDITFSQEMELTVDLLDSIAITVDDIDAKSNFLEPIISTDNKVITFLADETNLIDFTAGTKEVLVTIPKNFHYLQDEIAVYLREDLENTYKINPETKNKLNLVVERGSNAWGNSNFFGNLELSIGQEKEIIFSLDSNYMFAEWQVKKNGSVIAKEDYEQFLDISDATSSIITIKSIQAASDYSLAPYCIKRPKVVSTSPNSPKTSVFRDKSISITFDTTLDKSSIYYSTEELKNLGVLSGNETIEAVSVSSSGYSLLKVDSNCYGYSKDSNVVWKNITITDTETNTSLLPYFQTPYFDSMETDILRIRTGNNTELLGNKIIQVTITNAGLITNGYFVTIQGEYSFKYKTNDKVDNQAPTFEPGEIDVSAHISSFSVRMANTTDTSYKSTNRALVTNNFKESASDIKNNNITTKTIWVYGNIVDDVSGPDKLRWKIETEDSPYYKKGSSFYQKEGYFPLESLNSQESYVSESLDLAALNLPDGYYSLTLIAIDKNGNEGLEKYYFVYDVTAPSFDISKLRSYVLPKYLILETVENSIIPDDVQKIEIRKNGSSTKTDVTSKLNADRTFKYAFSESASTNRNYVVDIILSDVVGLSSTYSVSDTYAAGMFYYNDGKFSMNYYPERKDKIAGIACNGNYAESSGKIREKIVDLVSYDVSNLCWGFSTSGYPKGDVNYRELSPVFEDDKSKTGLEILNKQTFKYYKNDPGYGYPILWCNMFVEVNDSGTSHLKKSYWSKLRDIRYLQGDAISWNLQRGDKAYISWYIPTIEEVSTDIFGNITAINNQLGKLSNAKKIEWTSSNNLKEPLITMTSRSSSKDKFFMKNKMDTNNSSYVLQAKKENYIQNSWLRCLAIVDVTGDTAFNDVGIDYFNIAQ